MNETEKQPHRMKAAVILAAGAVLFFLWLGFWSYGAQYWPAFRSLLPPSVYFPIEEFLALNGHNSPWCLLGGGLIAAGFIVWAIRANGRKLRIWEHNSSCAASDSSDRSDKVRGKPETPLAKNPDSRYIASKKRIRKHASRFPDSAARRL